jgi:hypothetical protein
LIITHRIANDGQDVEITLERMARGWPGFTSGLAVDPLNNHYGKQVLLKLIKINNLFGKQ